MAETLHASLQIRPARNYSDTAATRALNVQAVQVVWEPAWLGLHIFFAVATFPNEESQTDRPTINSGLNDKSF
jgi:hypothetical protein